MRKDRFCALLGATIVLIAAAALAVRGVDRTDGAALLGQPAFPGLAGRLDDVAWVRLSRGDAKIDFASVGRRWVVVGKGNYPAAEPRIRRLFRALADLVLVEPKTARPELFARLGLDDPANGNAVLVSLRGRLGNTLAELIIGNMRRDRLGDGADGIYVRKPGDGEGSWLARGVLDVPVDSIDWLDRSLIDLPPARIAAIRLTGADGAALALRREKPDGTFIAADLPHGLRVKKNAPFFDLAAVLAGFEFDDVRPTAELALPEHGVAAAEFTTFDGLSVRLRLVEEGGRDWIALTASATGATEAEAESAAINTRVARWAYAVPAVRARLLRTGLGDVTEPAKGR